MKALGVTSGLASSLCAGSVAQVHSSGHQFHVLLCLAYFGLHAPCNVANYVADMCRVGSLKSFKTSGPERAAIENSIRRTKIM